MIKLKPILSEIMGAINFWVMPTGEIKRVGDHLGWFTSNVDSEFHYSGVGDFPTKSDGSIPEPEDVYELAYKMGYVTLTKYVEGLVVDYFRGNSPTQKQWKSIKDFAIENRWKLFDGVIDKEIDLL